MAKKMKVNENSVVTEKFLLNRGKSNNRNLSGTYSKAYEAYKRNEETYKKNLSYQQEWAKQNYWVYGLPLNVNYEADLILYLDTLPTLKPYIADLIRKEMKKPYVKKQANEREYVKGDNTKRRCFSLKFNKVKDKDIIDYLETKESKRAYLIGLIEKDMESAIKDGRFEAPKSLEKYNGKNKIKRRHVKKNIYTAIYNCIQEKIDEGVKEISFKELADNTKSIYGEDLNPHSYSTYRNDFFGNSGVLVAKDDGTAVYKIYKTAFKRLTKPENFK